MTIPDRVKEEIKEYLWSRADALNWTSLNDRERARHYAIWTDDANIGAVLARYIPKGKVRVYLKDTLLKPYIRVRMSDHERPLRVMGIDGATPVAARHIKPHGITFSDGRVVCWADAAEWRHVLLSTHERAFEKPERRPYSVALFKAVGRYSEVHFREMVQVAASLLGIEKVVWLET